MIRWLRSLFRCRVEMSVADVTPVPEEPWSLEQARERDATSPWKKRWIGNGVPGTTDWNFIAKHHEVLHDHPRSRPATVEPCKECGFPDLGWGGFDHYGWCAKHYKNRPRDWIP